MSSIKIMISEFSQREEEIKLPAFYKDNSTSITDIVGILDENTMVRVWEYHGSRLFIENQCVNGRDKEIAEIIEKFKPATEVDFFEAFDRVYESLSLTPKLKS